MKAAIFLQMNRWVNGLFAGGLEDAYRAAIVIKAMEQKHFDGDRIEFAPDKGKTSDYFQTQLNRQLLKVRIGLAQFRLSSFINPQADRQRINTDPEEIEKLSDRSKELESLALEKLAFIESVVSKYRTRLEEESEAVLAEVVVAPPDSNSNTAKPINPEPLNGVVAISQPPHPQGMRLTLSHLPSHLGIGAQ